MPESVDDIMRELSRVAAQRVGSLSSTIDPIEPGEIAAIQISQEYEKLAVEIENTVREGQERFTAIANDAALLVKFIRMKAQIIANRVRHETAQTGPLQSHLALIRAELSKALSDAEIAQVLHGAQTIQSAPPATPGQSLPGSTEGLPVPDMRPGISNGAGTE